MAFEKFNIAQLERLNDEGRFEDLADPLGSYREAWRLLRIGGQLLVADWALGDRQGGPPQHVRASGQQIAGMLSAVGFESIVAHPDLPRHSLLTARKPVVCGI